MQKISQSGDDSIFATASVGGVTTGPFTFIVQLGGYTTVVHVISRDSENERTNRKNYTQCQKLTKSQCLTDFTSASYKINGGVGGLWLKLYIWDWI